MDFYNLRSNLRELYTTSDVPELTKGLNLLMGSGEKPLSERTVKSWIMPSSLNKPTLDNLDLLVRYFQKSFDELIGFQKY